MTHSKYILKDKTTEISMHDAVGAKFIIIEQNDHTGNDVVVLTRKQWRAIVGEVTRTYMLKDEYYPEIV